jgi:hypothetical protein
LSFRVLGVSVVVCSTEWLIDIEIKPTKIAAGKKAGVFIIVIIVSDIV